MSQNITLTDTQLDCLADCIEYLIKLSRKQKAEAGRGSEAHPNSAECQAVQPKQSDSITLSGESQKDGGQDGA